MEDQEILIQFRYVVAVVASLVVAIGALVTAIVVLWKSGEKKSNENTELTKSFVTTTKDAKNAIDNNTKVIEKLPEQFVLLMKANGK